MYYHTTLRLCYLVFSIATPLSRAAQGDTDTQHDKHCDSEGR